MYNFDNSTQACNSAYIAPFKLSKDVAFFFLSPEGCDLETKINTAIQNGADLIILRGDVPQPDIPDDLSIPLISISSAITKNIDQLFLDAYKMKAIVLVELQTDSPTLSQVWEFTLIIVVVLLAASFMLSVFMHCHIYRLRRRARANAAPPAHPVLDQDLLSTLPIRPYEKAKYSDRSNAICKQSKRTLSADLTASKNTLYRSNSLPTSGLICDGVPDLTLTKSPSDLSTHSFRTTSSNADVCPICIEEFHRGDPVRVLPCRHEFHVACIDPWLTTKSPLCPLCKFCIHRGPSPPAAEAPVVHTGWRRWRNRYSTQSLQRNLPLPVSMRERSRNFSLPRGLRFPGRARVQPHEVRRMHSDLGGATPLASAVLSSVDPILPERSL